MNLLLQTTEMVAEATETAQTVQTMGLGELFLAGGWLMWPLLALGGVTIFIFFERFWAIRKASQIDMNFMNRIRDMIYDGKIAARRSAVPQYRQPDRPDDRKGDRTHRPSVERRTFVDRKCGESGSVRNWKMDCRSWPPLPGGRLCWGSWVR